MKISTKEREIRMFKKETRMCSIVKEDEDAYEMGDKNFCERGGNKDEKKGKMKKNKMGIGDDARRKGSRRRGRNMSSSRQRRMRRGWGKGKER